MVSLISSSTVKRDLCTQIKLLFVYYGKQRDFIAQLDLHVSIHGFFSSLRHLF